MNKDERSRELGQFVDPDDMTEDALPGEVMAGEVNEELFGHAAGADTAGTTGLPVQKPVDMASDSQIPEELLDDAGVAEKSAPKSKI